MLRSYFLFCSVFVSLVSFAQLNWQNVDSAYQPLPQSIHVFFTSNQIDTAPFRAFYFIADLKNKHLDFTTDTTYKRRFTPAQFYEKTNHPLVVVNGTFFSFETNQNLNLVVKDGQLVSYNKQDVPGRGKDTFTYRHVFPAALGITKKRKADIAWTWTDSFNRKIYALQSSMGSIKDSFSSHDFEYLERNTSIILEHHASPSNLSPQLKKWKMRTAIGGGPVLLQAGQIKISNEEEIKFTGKGINDKHPRTAMGYTADHKLIILVIEGRNTVAHGATLQQEAQILKDLGCIEALNLDGGGSSCLLINGKPTITVSDKEGQRPVPGVFIIRAK